VAREGINALKFVNMSYPRSLPIFIPISVEPAEWNTQWLARLRNKIAVAKIRSRMDRLEMGNAGDVKAVGDGVHEMRIHTGAGYRVYFVERGLEIVVLLCGGERVLGG